MMDPENIGKEAIIKVSHWLRGVWEMRRRNSPVQQWVDSLPSPENFPNSNLESLSSQNDSVNIVLSPVKSAASISESVIEHFGVSTCSESSPVCDGSQDLNNKENIIKNSNMTVSLPIVVPNPPSITCSGVSRLVRDPSFQSDSSHCSSVESLLELRRADPEAILLSLGFGGGASSPQDQGPLSRIPKRFLQPSRLKGIVINDFVKQQQETSESLDSASLGYRGLTGSPHVVPSEIVQKIMQRLREQESHELDAYNHNNINQNQIMVNSDYNIQDHCRLSVLSPDNRQYLDRPRSKSPDMRNKRMIIGQRSFTFGNDGDLIEIKPPLRRQTSSPENDDILTYSDNSKEFSSRPGSSSFAIDSLFSSTPKKLTFLENRENADKDSSEVVINPQSVYLNCNNNNNNIIESEARYHTKKLQDETLSNQHLYQSTTGSVNELFLDEEEISQNSVQFSPKFGEIKKVCETFGPTCKRKSILKRQAKVETDAAESYKKLDNSEKDLMHECIDDCECQKGEAASYRIKKVHKNCQKEMKKVLPKNKKLKDTAAQNHTEMAEVKDMLNSVLSVRMEPGF